MQLKIESFFHPSAGGKPIHAPAGGAALREAGFELPSTMESPSLDVAITYKRRRSLLLDQIGSDEEVKRTLSKHSEARNKLPAVPAEALSETKIHNKKKCSAQYYLDFGQSDFLLHTCSICSMRYARGEKEDEKVHKTFHNNCYLGIPFKGWRSERVLSMNKETGERIILVLDGDPPAHNHKVLEVVKLLENDLGLSEGWLLHKFCKVYLFISNNRIIGSVFAEPIKHAYKVISSSTFSDNSSKKETEKLTAGTSSPTDVNSTGKDRSLLQYGEIKFQRELIRRIPSNDNSKIKPFDNGAIFHEEEPVLASCGVRAIWVAPSRRRQGIATKLLDSMRESFEPQHAIEAHKCAFSQPTSAGKAFAAAYNMACTFLVYRADDR